ncbi:MAG: thymidine phosphorylase, partial [Eubacteriales bacterium]
LPLAKHKFEVKSDFDGYVCHIDAEKIGLASMSLGAGRAKKDDKIDFGAGIVLKVGVSDKVSRGDTLAVTYASDKSLFDGAGKLIKEAFSFSDKKPEEKELILDTIS